MSNVTGIEAFRQLFRQLSGSWITSHSSVKFRLTHAVFWIVGRKARVYVIPGGDIFLVGRHGVSVGIRVSVGEHIVQDQFQLLGRRVVLLPVVGNQIINGLVNLCIGQISVVQRLGNRLSNRPLGSGVANDISPTGGIGVQNRETLSSGGRSQVIFQGAGSFSIVGPQLRVVILERIYLPVPCVLPCALLDRDLDALAALRGSFCGRLHIHLLLRLCALRRLSAAIRRRTGGIIERVGYGGQGVDKRVVRYKSGSIVDVLVKLVDCVCCGALHKIRI